ncbi:hypothetical protein [Sphingomonas jaspsi]|uniref:hypothetical protein n=1 Tax=Sphingomonas jaspsi TaxID=392409 RepID=UPI00056AA3FE|nr:hypothetical protein [Sphingomonas jaspsi]
MTYQTTISVDPQRVQDMIVGAFEGGSNYWLGRGRVELLRPAYAELPDDGVVWYGNSKRNVFAEDFKVTIAVPDDALYTLEPASVTNGLRVMAEKYARHFADMTSENDDADTHDVFLQCCLFGDVIYG